MQELQIASAFRASIARYLPSSLSPNQPYRELYQTSQKKGGDRAPPFDARCPRSRNRERAARLRLSRIRYPGARELGLAQPAVGVLVSLLECRIEARQLRGIVARDKTALAGIEHVERG